MKNALLVSRDGRRFLVAQLMDSLCAGLSMVVLPWLVLDAGGSRTEAGAAFLAGTVPYVVLGLHAGHLGDRLPRRRILIAGTLAQAAAALVVPLAVLAGAGVADLPVALIFATGLGIAAGRVYVDAAAFGAIARLLDGDHFVEGQAALSFVWSLGFLVGPALGGALIGLVGAVTALAVQAAGFLVASVLMRSLRTDLGPRPGEAGQDPGDVLSGLRLVWRDPVLRSLTAVGMGWNLTVNTIYALIVVFARQDLHASPAEAGLMLAIGGAAGLVGGAIAPAVRSRLGPTMALRGSLVLSALGSIAVAEAGTLRSAGAAFALLEFSGLLFVTLLIGERQHRAGAHEQGRVGITGRMVALLAATTGGVLGSVAAGHMALGTIFLLAAAATVAVTLAGLRAIRIV
jgi:predicted MFS family arabinose efflux permease